MCWPSLEGGVVIEERPRRHKNEPRRKRLHFVKEHRSNGSDEWDLIDGQSGRSRQDMVEHHRPPPYPQWPPDPRYFPQQQPRHSHPAIIPLGEHRQVDRRSHHDPDEIIRVEEFVPRDNQHHVEPIYVEREPRDVVARMPSHLRPRSRSRGRGHSRHSSNPHSLFSDDGHSDNRHGGGGRRRHGDSYYSDNDSFDGSRPAPRRRINRVTRFRRIQ